MKLPKLPSIKKLINDENKTKVIGLLTILISIWLVLYFIPELFVSLFNTLLGNLILIVMTLLIYMNNRIYGLGTGLLFILLFRFSRLSRKESFSVNIDGTFTINNAEDQDNMNNGFTQDSKLNFLKIQNTINKQKVFDMNVIRSQASQEELDYFNKNGMWPWSQKVIELYQEAVKHNPYIRTLPEMSTNYARTIYNEAAILRLLSYQTKEGQFLLNGVLVKDQSGNDKEDLPSGFGEFGYKAGLIGNLSDDIIKCNLKDDSNPTLERITYTGKGGIFGEQTEKVTPVDYKDLEKLIPGFTFLNSSCNPCKSMADIPDYSCPFRLKVKNKSPFISDVWQYLWNINDNPLESQPSFLSEYVNPNEFPLLSELQTELQKQNRGITT
jgi:hypothetical protein